MRGRRVFCRKSSTLLCDLDSPIGSTLAPVYKTILSFGRFCFLPSSFTMFALFIVPTLISLTLSAPTESQYSTRGQETRLPGKTWPGWPGISHIFAFGDSYTTTGFDVNGAQPSEANPLGNPPYPGYTSSNGPNWVDFLTTTWNKSYIETVNLAYGGATVDSALVRPYRPTVLSVQQQINEEYIPVYSGSNSSFKWRPNDTLFAIFIGINDVGNAYGWANKSDVYPRVFSEYAALMV